MGPWTVFGAIEGDDIRVETAGEFGGRRSMNGYGFWQPVLRGKLTPTATGTVLQGTVRFRRSVWVVVGLLVLLAVSLGGLIPGAVGDLVDQDFGSAIPPLLLVAGIVVVPTMFTASVMRLGWREAHALRTRLEHAMRNEDGSTG